jgi:hypothetical protein
MGIRSIAVLLLLAATAVGGQVESRLQNEYRKAKSPDARATVVKKLAEVNSDRAADMMAKIADEDPDAWVRELAIWGLSKSESKTALRHLLELFANGGGERRRRSLAKAFSDREGGREALLELLDNPKADDTRRILVIEALSRFHDLVSLHKLHKLATDDRYLIRTEALRSLAARPDAAEDLLPILTHALKHRTDAATLLTVLDLLEARPDFALLPVLKKMGPQRSKRVTKAIDHAILTLEMEKVKAARRAAKKDGYDVPDPKKTPAPRPRYDLVFAFDATWSMEGVAGRVQRYMREMIDERGGDTADFRVGIVVFRQTKKGVSWKHPDVLPLTHEIHRAKEFLTGAVYYGADSQGAAIYHGLHFALDRMAWRPNARRELYLFCDTKTHDFGLCKRAILRHRDEVEVHFVWCGRKLHETVRKLAGVAGTDVKLVGRILGK